MGVVLGDLAVVALTILRLCATAEALGSLFVVIKVAAGCDRLWLLVRLLRARAPAPRIKPESADAGCVVISLVAGFVLTVGDVKAILFHAGLFPLLVDLSAVSAAAIAGIGLITVCSTGGVKSGYAVFASTAGRVRPAGAGSAGLRSASPVV